jgi:hypothetical protein
MTKGLYIGNHPARFWRLRLKPEPSREEWAVAAAAAAPVLPASALARGPGLSDLLDMTLGEAQFGDSHWRLGRARRLYYRFKPLLPRWLIKRLRRAHKRSLEGTDFELGWPQEDRYARFLWDTVGNLLRNRGATEAPFLHFWPQGCTAALVLTHDIETSAGQAFVSEVAGLEERLGFRSSFNFVAERYRLDHELIRNLQTRGFEVGVHGLKHDGQLFRSRAEFERRAKKINQHLRAMDAVGFRSPLTHRNPEWMQSLEIEYDLSFFDTDPYEPIPGGTMSLWPFRIGRFVELPYTLVQDYTLTELIGERTPALWLEKVDFLQRYCGMALLNTHPDYLRPGGRLELYADFLQEIRYREACWHTLPREAARWWRERDSAEQVASLRGAVEGLIRVREDGQVTVEVPAWIAR